MLSTANRKGRLLLDVPTVLVPSALFVPGREREWLDLNNLEYEEVIARDVGRGIVAVMACPRGVGGNVGSMFEMVLRKRRTTFWVGRERVYIAIWKKKQLVFCDSFRYETAADLAYYAVRCG